MTEGRRDRIPDAVAVRGWLAERVAEAAAVEPMEIDPDRPLEEYGLSSRDAVALSGELEELLDVELPATLLWECPTIAALARRLAGEQARSSAAAELPGPGHRAGEPVAVVGVGCRLPGGARGAAGFWELLAAGTDAISEVPAGRWADFAGGSAATDELLARTHRWGGFLADVTGFDAEFFGIAPREATLMDPQQRLLLEVTWEALEHAGIPPESLRGTDTGVFVGVCSHDYGQLTLGDLTAVDAWSATGAAASIAANRLSYVLDLRGPSVATDTACSSSLVTVHQACQSLRSGEIATALVGGVNLLLSPAATVNFEAGGALAADGRCKTFDAAADGIARAEGCGMVVLKRLSDARADGDRVLAVIRGSAVNSDGRSNGLTAPNPDAQQALLAAAYAAAGVVPSTVDYVEAHGTGTLLGDPIEAGALGAVLGAGRPADRPVLLGSVKTNLGHLEAAAGVTGLIKVVLAMAHDEIPASLHFSEPNPHIDFEGGRLRVATEPTPWPRYGGVARAGVSGFGFGGTNAHVVLEEHRAAPEDQPTPGAEVVVLSAPTPSRLGRTARDLADWLTGPAGLGCTPHEVSYTMARRGSGPLRAALVARSTDELVERLQALADGRRPAGVLADRAERRGTGAVWVFSGYGSQWTGMGTGLLADEPAFAAAVDELDPLFTEHAGFSLRKVLETGHEIAGLERTQLVIFGTQVALASLWRSAGLTPGAVIGYSMGEVAAAVVSGAIGVEDGVRVMAARSRLLAGLDDAGGGAMAAVELTEAEFEGLAGDHPGVGVAVYSGPQQLTVAGDAEAVARLGSRVDAMGRTARLLPVRGAGHSAAVDPVLAELELALAAVRGTRPEVPFYSSVLDDPRELPAFDAVYWAANTRRPVRFAQAVRAAAADGHTAFLEVSPHPLAAGAIAATLTAAGVEQPVVAASLRRGTDEAVTFRTNLAVLHCAGVPVDWRRGVPTGRLLDAPHTAWQHSRYWVRRPAPDPRRCGHPLLGVHVELPDGAHVWQTESVPAVGYEELVRAAGRAGLPADPELPADPADCDLALTTHHSVAAGSALTTTLRPDGEVTLHARACGGTWLLLATARIRRRERDVDTTGGRERDVPAEPVPAPEPEPPMQSTTQPAPEPELTRELVHERLRDIVAAIMGFRPDQMDPRRPLVELGLDSLMAVRIKNAAERDLRVPPLVPGMLRGASLADLADHVAGLLGLSGRHEPEPAQPVIGPRDTAERVLARMWEAELGRRPGSVTDDFFALGGDSFRAGRVAARLSAEVGRDLTAARLFTHPTIERMADLLRPLLDGGADRRPVRTLREGGHAAPLHLFHPAGGPCSVYTPLVELLDDVPCYGFERVPDGDLDQRVARHLALLCRIQPRGPYRLAGWSFGGALAYEAACQLTAAGEAVEFVALIDTMRPLPDPDAAPRVSTARRFLRFADYVSQTYGRPVRLDFDELVAQDEAAQIDLVMARVAAAGLGMSPGVLRHQRESFVDTRVAERHRANRHDGRVVLYRATEPFLPGMRMEPRYHRSDATAGWAELCGALEVVRVAGDHISVIDPPHVEAVATHLAGLLTGPRHHRR